MFLILFNNIVGVGADNWLVESLSSIEEEK
jgi:hypothetical protein